MEERLKILFYPYKIALFMFSFLMIYHMSLEFQVYKVGIKDSTVLIAVQVSFLILLLLLYLITIPIGLIHIKQKEEEHLSNLNIKEIQNYYKKFRLVVVVLISVSLALQLTRLLFRVIPNIGISPTVIITELVGFVIIFLLIILYFKYDRETKRLLMSEKDTTTTRW